MIQAIKEFKNQKIMIAPLDWGIGHATRCIPIIQQLLTQNNNIIIGSSGYALNLLQQEFPNLTFIELPAYNIQYSKNGASGMSLYNQIPKVIGVINKEQNIIKKLIQSENIDVLISDQRWGLYSSIIPSYFITHQLNIKDYKKRKWMEWIMKKVNESYINKFTACWVPDFEDEAISLSGELSHQHTLKIPTEYIGPLSRFQNQWLGMSLEKTYKCVVLLSGPEPQRTILEKLIIEQLDKINLSTALLLGKPSSIEKYKHSQFVDVYSHLPSDKLLHLLLNADFIIARSGYSTIMDLQALGKKAILIPTPGQTEQEYLANYFKQKRIFFSEEQHTFNLNRALSELNKYNGFIIKD